MKVLVTGGTGFIGTNLVSALLENGEKVRVLVRKSSNIEKLKGKNIEIFVSDVLDIESLKRVTKGVDIVYHLAALLGSPDVTEKELREVNVHGTRNILEASVLNKVKRFLYLSAGAVMGNSKQVLDETMGCNPYTPYAKSKYDAEQLVLGCNLPATIVRSTMVYGPGEMQNKLRMMKMIKKGLFKVIGDGENRISLVYVDNLVQGIILASRKERAVGEIYIISDKRAYTMNEFVGTIADELGVKKPSYIPKNIAIFAAVILEGLSKVFRFSPPLFRDRVMMLTSTHVFDCTKACRELGYKPSVTLNEGIKRTIEYYKEIGVL